MNYNERLRGFVPIKAKTDVFAIFLHLVQNMTYSIHTTFIGRTDTTSIPTTVIGTDIPTKLVGTVYTLTNLASTGAHSAETS